MSKQRERGNHGPDLWTALGDAIATPQEGQLQRHSPAQGWL